MKTVTIRAAALTLVLGLSLIQIDGGWLWNPASASGSGSPSQPSVHILDSDEAGITLELYTPDFQIEPLATEEITCDRLSVTDYATNDQAGWPALPMRGAMLGIPPDANVTLTVLSIDAKILSDHYDLCPVATPVMETELSGEIRFGGYQLVRDIQAYATDALWPTHPAELVETGFIRSQRVAQLRFHPFQYNPTSGEMRHLERIQVRLDFNRDGSALDTTIGIINEGAFEETLSHTLLNYDAARTWRMRPTSLDRQDLIDWPLPPQTEPSYKIAVEEDGIYEVSYADLQAAGIMTATLDSLDPRTFQLHNQGQEVAIYVEGETDESFDQEDYILFYGQKMNTKYTNTNVYWLTWGDENGARMPTVDGTPAESASIPTWFLTTNHIEENLLYQSRRSSGSDEDHWFASPVAAYSEPASGSYTTTLQPAAVSFSATMRGLLLGYHATSEHHAHVYLNGHLTYTATWAAQTEYAFEVNIPHSYLLTGTNTISITSGIGDLPDVVLVNWFEIDYYATYTAEKDSSSFDGDESDTWEYQVTDFTTDTLEIFDITSPITPTRILSSTIYGSGIYTLTFQHTITNEHHYLALATSQINPPSQIKADTPSNLHSTGNSADYIIITHADFYTEAQRLVTYSVVTRGLRTIVVDVQDIYDEFSYGIYDPEAIKNFLAYAYAYWKQPAPVYVLLIGDGNFDPKDYMGREEPSYISPYLAYVDPWMGETAADNRYVCISGEDILPDMHLGRLPVQTSTEAATVVTKIINYEQNSPTDNWNQNLLFVADNPDSAGNFYALSDAVIDYYVPDPYIPQKVYYGDTHLTALEAEAAIIATINTGTLLVNYVGHGSRDIWASEHLFDAGSIAVLSNTERLPFMVPMTCLEGYFIIPNSSTRDYSSLGERILRPTGKGAIASWSPTGLGIAQGHDYLNKGLFEALFYDGVSQLGPATTQGKLYLYSNAVGFRDLLDTYLLFGDPALKLNVLPTDLSLTKTSEPSSTIQLATAITYTITYSNTGPATAHHVVISDVLPTDLTSPTITHTGATITLRPGSRLAWDVEDLAPGEGGVITITTIPNPVFSGTLSNTATITATVVESNLDNNQATTVLVLSPNLYYFPIITKNTALTDPMYPRYNPLTP